MIWKRGILAALALAGTMVAGSAHAAGGWACWTFAFVPGQHVPHDRLTEIQNGHTYYSDEFDITGMDPGQSAELFEAYVRKTQPPPGPGAAYVSGCTMGNSDGGPKSTASKAHERFFRESAGRSTDLHWTPSAEEMAKLPPSGMRGGPLYMQCVATPYSPRFYDSGAFSVGPVFQTQARDYQVKEEFQAWMKANNIDAVATCLSARTREQLKAKLADEIDHSKPGSPVTQISFTPTGATAAPKAAAVAPPKPPPKGYIEIKPDTSGKDAAKAWDEQVKKGLADRARKDVETAAKAAQQDAETKRKIAEFMAERRRQGNKQ